jgi:sec-independent protein translocase protein TatC
MEYKKGEGIEHTIRDGPVGDEEVPVLEHFLELRKRLIVFAIPCAIFTLVIFPFSDTALHFLYTSLFSEDISLAVYNPTEWLGLMLLFSFLSALSITMPLLLYEIFAFVRPGLYPSERIFFLQVVIPSLFAYVIGVLFAYYFVLPLVFSYLIAYSGDFVRIAFSAKRVFSVILYTAVAAGLIFQIPLIMTLAVKMKIVTYDWLKEKRLIIYGLIIGIAFFIIADPMGISMLMSLVAIALFELGLLLSRYIGRKRK